MTWAFHKLYLKKNFFLRFQFQKISNDEGQFGKSKCSIEVVGHLLKCLSCVSIKKTALLSDEDDDTLLDNHTVVNLDKISSHPNGKINRLQKQVDDVLDGMKINLDKVVDRGQSLSELNDRSDQLGITADLFSKRSKGLRKSMWLRTCRARLYLSITIGFILLLIICKLHKNRANFFI